MKAQQAIAVVKEITAIAPRLVKGLTEGKLRLGPISIGDREDQSIQTSSTSPIGRRARFRLYQSRVTIYRLAKNSMSKSFTSFGRSCWIQCPAPGTRTFFVKPGIVSSKLSKAC